jgi:hypothetical protein
VGPCWLGLELWRRLGLDKFWEGLLDAAVADVPWSRVWVFDRGIVSEENLAALRRRNGQYLVGTPRSKLKQFEAELLGEGWERVRDDVEVKRVGMPGGEETYVLCRTAARMRRVG